MFTFKFNYATAAMLAAMGASALASDEFSSSTQTIPDTEIQAVAAPTPVTSGATLVKAAPTAAEVRARSYQGWLNQINKPYANQLAGGNGTGVLVGVVDSGVQVNHPSLNGQVVATYNAYTGGTDVTDQMGHGTHVSGIIAGTTAKGGLLEGVAPGAKLVIAKVFTTGSSDSVTIGRGIDWVVNVKKAPILSLSLGSSAAAMQSNIQNAVTKGTLITAALGNDGRASASWPAGFAKASWAKGQIIAVGALDANNKRASFSNYDATLANWTVFAPGVNIASTYSVPGMQSNYAYMSGTSMATPIVAGQAALIKSNWNFLIAPDIAQIIFQSATHLCSDAVSASVCTARKTADAMYGWGLVNVGASLQPLGSLNVATKTGTLVNYSGSAIAGAKAGLATGLKGINTLAVDKFNRGFTVNLTTAVTAASVTTAAVPVASATSVKAAGVKLSAQYAPATAAQNAWNFGEATTTGELAKISYSFTNDQGSSYGFGSGGTAAAFFGLASTGVAPLSLNGEASRFNAPYMDLAEAASHIGYGYTLQSGTVLRMGVASQAAATPSVGLDTGAPVLARSVALFEMQKSFGAATGLVTVGQLLETNSALGMTGAGALDINASTGTSFMTLAASLPFANKTSLSAMATVGQTAAYGNTSASLIDGASASQSAAWSLGLARKELFRDGDSLGLTLAMPLRTMSGAMQITTAVAQDQATGALEYASQSVSLQPTGSQRDVELAYTSPTRMGGQLSALAQIKFQPGHDAAAPTQFGFGIKFLRSFR
jgi:subtilisin family serine protease